MKKVTMLLLSGMLIITGSLFSQNAQDTIAAWYFPEHSADSLIDAGLDINSSRYLSCEYGTWGSPGYYELEIDYTATGASGGSDKCAGTTGWNDGADSITWIVKFKTPNYRNLKVYSMQKSDSENPGPKDFKIQYKLSGSTSPWNDLDGGIITCSDNWEDGAIEALPLPEECEDQSSNVSLRWIVTSNLNINGNPIDENGISYLDNIVILGEQITGIEQINMNTVTVYPNPSVGNITIRNLHNITRVELIDINGRVLLQEDVTGEIHKFDRLVSGIYFVNCYAGSNLITTVKSVVY
jgi:hypothetical protein